MSLFPKGLPGSSFAAYLSQEKQKAAKKEEEWRQKYQGVFQDVEAQAAKDLEYEPNYPELLQQIKDETGRVDIPKLRYKGLLDGRIPRPYPGPAKEGSFWVVEYSGTVGSFADVKKGDILVRLTLHTNSEWILIPNLSTASFIKNTAEDYDTAVKVTQKHLKLLKADLQKATPKTKAAPGPQKRKVILEDD